MAIPPDVLYDIPLLSLAYIQSLVQMGSSVGEL